MLLPKILLSIMLVAFTCFSSAQTPSQIVRGVVLDQDSKVPLIGANVRIVNIDPQLNAATDLAGKFRIEAVPVGRRIIEISYLGYESAILQNIVVSSGKELVLTIELAESLIKIEEVVITAGGNKTETLNEMSTLSGRTFSVEETQRYAASFLDPARMAQNFAGVSSAGDDLSNEIVIRGNSPAYVQWRLEGVQIPGPNHFADKGSSGGGISMLSNSMLANSDFYTGAFPAEIGNALAGAFDLNFRKGNNEKRENSILIGVVGLEASTEGPIGNGGASYLFNYRYSALELISKVANLDFGDSSPNFQDLSFNISIPTKKLGRFSLFGLGGMAVAQRDLESDPDKWNSYDDIQNFKEKSKYALGGVTHRYLFPNQRTYLKTVLATTFDQYKYNEEYVDIANNNQIIQDENESLTDKVIRASITLNHKQSAKSSFRTGVVLSKMNFDFSLDNRDITRLGNLRISYGPSYSVISSKGSTNMYQFFAQNKYKPSEKWIINTGVHYTKFVLTGSEAIEPRLGVKYQFHPSRSIAISAGLHSQAEHLINYNLMRTRDDGSDYQPNIDLGLTRAAHFVVGYDHNFSSVLRIKMEAYFQHLFNVPVDNTFEAGSIINARNVYEVLYQSNELLGIGKGRNMGVDLTFERFLKDGYYFLVTGSLFDSTFSGKDGKRYNTRFNSRYNLTVLGGKEFSLGASQQNTFGINGKLVFNGGNRYSEFDFDTNFFTEDGIYKLQIDPYARMDIAFSYKINKASTTHTIALEIQNLTNRKNVYDVRPDFGQNNYWTSFQNGLIPNFNYRFEF